MKKIMVLIILFNINISYARIINDFETRDWHVVNATEYYAQCIYKLDTETRNISYDYKGVSISELLVYDKNDLVISRSGYLDRHYDGYVHMPIFTGEAVRISAYGYVTNDKAKYKCKYGSDDIGGSCMYPIQCDEGYIEYNYKCIYQHHVKLPSHALWTYSNSDKWQCDDGYKKNKEITGCERAYNKFIFIQNTHIDSNGLRVCDDGFEYNDYTQSRCIPNFNVKTNNLYSRYHTRDDTNTLVENKDHTKSWAIAITVITSMLLIGFTNIIVN